MSLPASKPTRNAELRHRQSLGRQRQAARHDPVAQAMAIAQVARKCLDDGRTMDAVYVRDLPEDTWAELTCAATPRMADLTARAEQRDERERLRRTGGAT